MKPLVVVGGGGFAREVLDVVDAINAVEPEWEVLGVLDDRPSDLALERLTAREVSYLGGIEWLSTQARLHLVLAVGSPRARSAIAQRPEVLRHTAISLIHPGATVGTLSKVDDGSVICAGTRVSTNVRLGRHVHINPGAIIGHDARLDDFVSVNPGAVLSGDVSIHAMTLVGAGAVILQGLSIGEGATIGASACVTQDVAERTTVVGVPARARSGS